MILPHVRSFLIPNTHVPSFIEPAHHPQSKKKFVKKNERWKINEKLKMKS